MILLQVANCLVGLGEFGRSGGGQCLGHEAVVLLDMV